MTLTDDQFKELNLKRAADVNYFDEVAAMDVLGAAKNGILTGSPLLCLLEYGKNRDEYWTRNHMVVQLKKCIDWLKVLYGDAWEFAFLFGHSSGHAKKGVNDLDAPTMNSKHIRILQHSRLIKEEEGHLSTHHDTENPQMAKVGEKQFLN